jgi:hypothetical protein
LRLFQVKKRGLSLLEDWEAGQYAVLKIGMKNVETNQNVFFVCRESGKDNAKELVKSYMNKIFQIAE